MNHTAESFAAFARTSLEAARARRDELRALDADAGALAVARAYDAIGRALGEAHGLLDVVGLEDDERADPSAHVFGSLQPLATALAAQARTDRVEGRAAHVAARVAQPGQVGVPGLVVLGEGRLVQGPLPRASPAHEEQELGHVTPPFGPP